MNPTLYVEAHVACLYEYHSQQGKDSTSSILAGARLAEEYLQMLMNAGQEDKAIIERSIQYLAGQYTYGRVCTTGALCELAPLIPGEAGSFDPLLSHTDATVSMKAQSIATFAYYKKYLATSQELAEAAMDAPMFPLPDGVQHTYGAVDSLIRAVEYANKAACLQFISTAVLLVARAFRDLAWRLGMDVWKFKKYTPLWRALERHDREEYDERTLWRRHEGDILPEETMCGAPGCTRRLEGQTKEQRRPCLGNCVWNKKPWYCSSACREKDWVNHRKDCKPPPPTRPPSELPPTVALDRNTRDQLTRCLSLRSPFFHCEIVSEDVNPLDDARNGITLPAQDMQSPHVPGQMVSRANTVYI